MFAHLSPAINRALSGQDDDDPPTISVRTQIEPMLDFATLENDPMHYDHNEPADQVLPRRMLVSTGIAAS